MKIAFVNQPWTVASPEVGSDSIGIWTNQVARRLARYCDVIFYGSKGYFQKQAEYYEGVHYRRIWPLPDKLLLKPIRLLEKSGVLNPIKLLEKLGFLTPKHPFFASSLYYLGYILQVANDLREQQCDIVHVQNFSQFVPIIRAINPGTKIVLHMHCQWLTQLDHTMIEQRLRQVDLVIGCSEYITEKVRRRFPQFAERCQTIFNGVDIDYFTTNNERRASNKNDTKQLLFLGRVSPEKGVHILLDALAKVVERYPQVHLNIVGPFGPAVETPLEFLVRLSDDDNKVAKLALFYAANKIKGKQLSYFEQIQQRLSPELAGYVTFCGSVLHSEVINNYREADIFINSSLSEAFPIPIPEAMASSLPIIATRVGGIPEAVIHEKVGLLVEAGDSNALAEALLRLLKDDNLRTAMGNAACERAVDLFSWEQITENLLYKYKSLYEKT